MHNNIEQFDVCIIGGSIAGNYLCYLLSKTKLKIAVIEEHNEIGFPIQCAGIVSQKLKKLIKFPEEIIINRVEKAILTSPSGKIIKLSGNEKPLIIDRAALDKYFYEEAKKNKNVSYFLNEKFISFKYRYVVKEQQQKLLINTSKRRLLANLIVGCDGPLSSVGRLMNIQNNIIYATQIRVKTNFPNDQVLMHFDPRWKELFGWIVPEGVNSISRIGIASFDNIAENFRIFLKKIHIDINNAINHQGGIIPYGIMNKTAFENGLLLGDSACQVKASTGGGIIMLLTCAKFAANCIIKCFKTQNFSKEFIEKFYEQPSQNIIGKELKIHYLIRKIIELFRDKDYKKIFQIIKSSKIENLISIYGDMDFPKTLLFKLLKSPLFISFLIKFLFRNPLFFVRSLIIFAK
jgi:digeranylgeranylglycerophospholipid reductase